VLSSQKTTKFNAKEGELCFAAIQPTQPAYTISIRNIKADQAPGLQQIGEPRLHHLTLPPFHNEHVVSSLQQISTDWTLRIRRCSRRDDLKPIDARKDRLRGPATQPIPRAYKQNPPHAAKPRARLTKRNRSCWNRACIALPSFFAMCPIAKRALGRQPTSAQRDRRLTRQIPLLPIHVHQRDRPFHAKRSIRPNRDLHCRCRSRLYCCNLQHFVRHKTPLIFLR
jgi:hypothetical protein